MRPDQPSRTAIGVAVRVLHLSYDPRYGHLVAPEAVEPIELMLRAAPRPFRWMPSLARRAPVRALFGAIERRALRGATVHLGLRKRWMEHEVRAAIEDGATQVVILGGGFDSLAWRLHGEFPEVRWIEFDHPATQAPKRRALAGRAGPNLLLVPADFEDHTLDAELDAIKEFDPGAPAVFVIEGVLYYLEERVATGLLRTVREHGPADSTLLGSALAPDAAGRPVWAGAGRLVPLLLRRLDEPFLTGWPRSDFEQRMSSLGFDEVATVHPAECFEEFVGATPADPSLATASPLRLAFGEGAPSPEGEYFFRARIPG